MKPWLKQPWCLPKKHNAEFVWRMEDVLEVYRRPYDPQRPVICMDEAGKQLVAEVRQPLPPEPGKPLRYDCEYERRGTRNIFMFCEPLRGWRHVRLTQRRTRVDGAIALRALLDQQYQDAERVVLVMDNLNTHSPNLPPRRRFTISKVHLDRPLGSRRSRPPAVDPQLPPSKARKRNPSRSQS